MEDRNLLNITDIASSENFGVYFVLSKVIKLIKF